MVLEKEQIDRYLRHIIMPEVSGSGQKKLLEAAVSIYGENVNDTAPAVYYLAASGVGSLFCNFEDAGDFDGLRNNVRDLNGDITIELAEGRTSDFRILFGGPEFIASQSGRFPNAFVPAIVCIHNGWKGIIKVCRDSDGMEYFFSSLKDMLAASRKASCSHDLKGNALSACFSGALCAMEAIKLSLNIGDAAGDFLYFDLLGLEFLRTGKENSGYALNQICSRNNTSQANHPEIMLKDKKVLIAGTGGLGSSAAYALALCGIGTIGLADYDAVEISNLNRQILHSASRIGQLKAESAASFLKKMHPNMNINKYNTSINNENVFEIIKDYDIVIDAVDNFPTRFLLNDACHFAGKPMIDAGVLRFDGTCTVFIPQAGPCYRCMLSDIPAPGSVPSCSEAGILGPVPGIMGFIQAAEAVKLLTGQGASLNGRMLLFDGMYSDFRTIELGKKSTCPLCGANPTIHELQKYEFLCI